MTVSDYLTDVNKKFQSGISREHAYRTDFENLLKSLTKDVDITNEPANVTDCGNPDFVITSGKIPVGYIEAKDVGKDLNSKSYKEQFTRYRNALDNLIITDYLWFQFFQNGELIKEIRIAEVTDGTIQPLTENFVQFDNLIKNFCTFKGQTIKSASGLAEMMAAKARLLQNTLENAVTSDEETSANTSLKGQLDSFKLILIHDITPKAFADLYAQTLAYGMFAARYHDPTLENFSRQEAAELIPKSNPFLRKLFQYIAGYDIDLRIRTTVENLAEVFRATDVKDLLSNFGKSTEQNDPIIHFYETFLAEYDPKLRKQRGVWYTPEPVVKFMVRAVDDILKDEFGIKDGLADTSKTKVKVKTMTKATADRRSKMKEVEIEKEVHKVQILDPATGTGTFLAEVVKFIYHKRFKAMQGVWSSYVENDLIPRLNGFELLMASYTMAHLKLDMLLTETGYKPTKDQRFNVYLTNSLEPGVQEVPNLFMAQWLTDESAKANEVKQDKPVMVVIGNPPYSGESANKGEWIMNLMEDYKKEPGGKVKLKEKNSKWINDDYVKFIRYGQYFMEKNGEGILAFINPHGFLDNPTFRGMRWNLLKTYDKIYTIDLHGNSKKKETCPDGSPDVNVFDIQQGVSINLFVKTGKKKESELGQIFHYDLYGKRELKYDFLNKNSLKTIDYNELINREPMYFMVEKDFETQKLYNKGFKVSELFLEGSLGLLTKRDRLSIGFTEEHLSQKIQTFINPHISTIQACQTYGLSLKDKDKWNAEESRLSVNFEEIGDFIRHCHYRPFDSRLVFYHESFVARPNTKVLRHFERDNIALVIGRQGQAVGGDEWNVLFVSNYMTEQNIYRRGGGTTFPLYLYENHDQLFKEKDRTANLNLQIIADIEIALSLLFDDKSNSTDNLFGPKNLFDYIYAVLHSPTYRETYKEFLKIDFPRVPYPKKETFWQLVELGKQLREIHLLESPKVEEYITTYPEGGDNVVTRKMTKSSIGYEASSETHGKVWINDAQYFAGVPLVAWEFYIGGYQPAQKWLKDRKERELSFDDILHYQKIIVALSETDRLMQEIDKIDFM